MYNFRASDGTILAYRDLGCGIPVLCLAGLTRNSSDFVGLENSFRDTRLIMMDYRGRGESDWDINSLAYTTEKEADDAFELLDHLDIDRVHIIGTSRGGLVAMKMATIARGRIDGILFNDIGPEIETAGIQRIFDHLGRNPEYQNLEDAAKQLASIAHGFRDVSMRQWRREAENRYRFAGCRLNIRYDPGLRWACIHTAALQNLDLWQEFKALNGMNLALIRGENSDVLSSETAANMQLACPDLIITTARNRGHCPFLDEPESQQAIARFLVARS
ncbi:MAG: alpha/beta hydrolase [Rhodobacteraceae bacterium]|nr:alpha/beta hydrolase [Paracoccaceae bacterium]MCY4196520.1 alpha/beta hydrolase [Paracoccaceae bacterium]MCY4327272.1 alpha/beta hydrolase [Paracoccaceae bacterium]